MKSKTNTKKPAPATVNKVELNIDKRSDVKWQLIIVVVAFVSFGLAVFNDYALDDFIVLVKNNFTQHGFGGIWKILSKDTFAGMTESNLMVLSGGRYRPLSLVTFAVEHQLWGNSPFLSHLINVMIYALTGLLLYQLMKMLLGHGSTAGQKWIDIKSAAITILFIVLPSHSEPVINIKGRDDLLCLLFFLLSAIQLIRYIRTTSNKHLIFSSLFYFLSLLSKESALTFVAIFPLMLYFFSDARSSKLFSTTSVYLSLAAIFLLFRYLATKGNSEGIPGDLLNDPLVFATFEQRMATLFLSWLFYLRLLVFPLHLSYDYNYNQLPLTGFSDWRVMLSVIVHVALLVIALFLLKRKSVYSFAILFYLITFSIFSNLFFNIGTIFADRFIYIPSIGFCIAVIYLGLDLYTRIRSNVNERTFKSTGAFLLVVIVLVFGMRDVSRCSDWKDNNTLFLADTDDCPNSTKVQLNAGIAYIELASKINDPSGDSLYKKALIHLEKGISIYPKFIDGYINMGVVYSRLKDYDNAEKWWNKAREINPNHSKFKEFDKLLSYHYMDNGLKKGVAKDYIGSIREMLMALRYDSLNADISYNLGGAYYTIQKKDSAIYYWKKTLKLDPANKNAMEGLRAIGVAL